MLSDRKIKSLKAKQKEYSVLDEKNLYIFVYPNGVKKWVFRTRYANKPLKIVFGKYPEVTKESARDRAKHARMLKAEGKDPRTVQKQFRATDKMTVLQVAQKWAATLNVQSETRERHIYNVEHCFPQPNMAIDSLTTAWLNDQLELFKSLGKSGSWITRVFSTLRSTCDFAVVLDLIPFNPVIALMRLLPKEPVKHFASTAEKKHIRQIVRKLGDYDRHKQRSTWVACNILPLLWCRPNELANAKWEQFDGNLWNMPVSKNRHMRDQKILQSVMPKQVMALLSKIPRESEWVFYGRAGNPMRTGLFRHTMAEAGIDNNLIVPHGFRSMARTYLREKMQFNSEELEHQLSHSSGQQLGGTYDRAQYMEQRQTILQTWADHLDDLRGYKLKY